MFADYQNNKGIVRTREVFLDWMASPEGIEKDRTTDTSLASKEKEDTNLVAPQRKIIIAPIAIPGCGKTSVSIALANLFGFAHTQSDDVVTKGKKTKTAPIFEANVRKLLQTDGINIVIADK